MNRMATNKMRSYHWLIDENVKEHLHLKITFLIERKLRAPLHRGQGRQLLLFMLILCNCCFNSCIDDVVGAKGKQLSAKAAGNNNIH